MPHRGRAPAVLAFGRCERWWRGGCDEGVLFFSIRLLRRASLPAIAPIFDQEVEGEGVDTCTRLKADAEVLVGHLVRVRELREERDVCCDSEEQIVIEGREFGQLFLEHGWCYVAASICFTLPSDA